MKIYRGVRTRDGAARVYVEQDGRRLPLAHVVFFSPDGFDYGAPGPGAMDLTRSILADHLGTNVYGWLCREFLRGMVLPLDPLAPWTLTGAEISGWLTGIRARGHSQSA